MIKETIFFLYLLAFRVVFIFFRLFPQQRKTFFMAYFGYNVLHTVEALEKHSDEKVIIIKTKHCRVNFKSEKNRLIVDLKGIQVLNRIKFMYHLATSDRVVVDNYQAFLSVTNFKKNTICVQLWHAAGALKKFGLEDMSVKERKSAAVKRFKAVYHRFDHVIVGSDEMADIFRKSFETPKEKILHTGIPRTDFFFDEKKKDEVATQLLEKYPQLKDKKVILYAPTFRDHEQNVSELPFSLDKLYEEFGGEYVLIYKLHPLLSNNIKNDYPDFAINLTNYENINHLLPITDILISDYSSVPFEFALLERPMIFYAYDLNEYIEKRGVQGDYVNIVPGPVVKTTEEIIELIKNNQFDYKKIQAFNNVWNKYSTGNSSENLVKFLIKR